MPSVGKQLHEDNEQTQRLILPDVVIPQIDDDQASGPYQILEPRIVVDVLCGQIQSVIGQLLERVGQRTARLRAGWCAASDRHGWLHDSSELADVEGLVADGTHQEPPVRGLQLGRGERQRPYVEVRIVTPALVHPVGWSQQQDVGQRRRLGSVAFPEGGQLILVAVGPGHAGELGRVVLCVAVVEDDAGQRVRKMVDAGGGRLAISRIEPRV